MDRIVSFLGRKFSQRLRIIKVICIADYCSAYWLRKGNVDIVNNGGDGLSFDEKEYLVGLFNGSMGERIGMRLDVSDVALSDDGHANVILIFTDAMREALSACERSGLNPDIIKSIPEMMTDNDHGIVEIGRMMDMTRILTSFLAIDSDMMSEMDFDNEMYILDRSDIEYRDVTLRDLIDDFKRYESWYDNVANYENLA